MNKDGTCTHLSSGGLSSVAVNLLDNQNPANGVNLDYYANYCNTTNRYNLNLQLQCDKYSPKTTYQLDLNTMNEKCTKRVIITSKDACPKVSLGRIWIFFNDYQIIFGILLVAIGGYLLIYGGKYHEHTMFLFGEIVVATFFLLVLFAFVYPPTFLPAFLPAFLASCLSASHFAFLSLLLFLFFPAEIDPAHLHRAGRWRRDGRCGGGGDRGRGFAGLEGE